MYNWHVDHGTIDESAAIEDAIAGDTAAFGVLVERYQEVAFRAAYLVTRDAQTAEDVAQDAFIRAYRRLGTFRRDEPFRPWLLRIVTNLALNEVRARTRRGGLFGRVAAFARRNEPSPHSEVAAADDASMLLRAIAELPEDHRIVLHLHYFLELPEREIALAIGTPQGTVKSRLHRASKRLRAVIEERYPGLRDINDG